MSVTVFDQLGDVRNVCTTQDITIQTTDWSSTAPYTYLWTSTMLTENSSVEILPREGSEAAQIEDFDYSLSGGVVTITVTSLPVAALPLTVKIVNAKPDGVQSLNASDISTEAITGADTVEEALETLDENLASIVKSTTANMSFDSSGQYISGISASKYCVLQCFTENGVLVLPYTYQGKWYFKGLVPGNMSIYSQSVTVTIYYVHQESFPSQPIS